MMETAHTKEMRIKALEQECDTLYTALCIALELLRKVDQKSHGPLSEWNTFVDNINAFLVRQR